VSQQLVPPPWTGGQADWHSESDVQLPHEPPPLLLPLPLPDDEPLLLLLETPLLLPLPELLLDEPLPDPLLLLLKPLLLPVEPELLPLLPLLDVSPPPASP
jgi:hypothetical protein